MDDESWARIEPLPPVRRRRDRRPGRKAPDDRRALRGILLVLRTGIPLAAASGGGNRNDVTRLMPLPAAVPRRSAFLRGFRATDCDTSTQRPLACATGGRGRDSQGMERSAPDAFPPHSSGM
ncbi:transposase [Streptomyces sp. NPDC085946]|uniref:transposase n=1 Tax=Streptomyces sp. NPDC085946 TaxID=3365744 RepID=UPI0037CD04AA